MILQSALLMGEAFGIYSLVLFSHAVKRRVGPALFFGLLGALTVLSWILAGSPLWLALGGVRFLLGPTLVFPAILLGVFAVYVFDGPRETRWTIFLVVGVSFLFYVLALLLNWGAGLTGGPGATALQLPGWRVQVASILTLLTDLVFLAMAWEFLGGEGLGLPTGFRAFLTFMGVQALDLALFSTLAFLGTPSFLVNLPGSLGARLVSGTMAFLVFYLYLSRRSRTTEGSIQDRPVLAIVKDMKEVRQELSRAQEEILRRTEAERENEDLIQQLQAALAEVQTLRGLIPICSSCRKVRDDEGFWFKLESFLQERGGATFSHGLCPSCAEKLYPGLLADEDEGS